MYMKQEIKKILTNEFMHVENRDQHVEHAIQCIYSVIKKRWTKFALSTLKEGVKVFGIKGGDIYE